MRVGILVVLVAAAARAGTVSVQLPEGTKCDFAQLRAALRVPPASVSETPQPDSVQLTLSREGEAWSLALEAPGQARLERKAFAQGDDCVAVFEAAALIVDRYLSSIDWNASPVEVSPLPPPEPPTPVQLMVELAGGVSDGVTGISGAGAAGLGVAYGALFAELEGAFLGLGQTSKDVDSNTVTLRQETWSAQALAGSRWKLGRGRLMLAVMGGIELFHISATAANAHPNPLINGVPGIAALPFAGLRLGYMVLLTERLSLGLRISARLRPHLAVRAEPNPLLYSGVGDGDLSLALAYLFF